MLQVQIKHAKPGMTLALPVRHPESPERCLLAAGYELHRRDVNRMEQLGIREIMVRYPGLEVIDRFINPRVMEQRGRMCVQLRHHFESAQTNTAVQLPYETYVHEMAGLVEELIRSPTSAVMIDQVDGNQPWLMRHSIDVAYLSVMMGLKLETYLIKQRRKLSVQNAKEVTQLGLGGMLHDVGMLKLSGETLERYAQTHDEKEPGFREHVTLGFKQVHGRVEPSAAAAVLHHHQCFDGSGYPARRESDGKYTPLVGERIHVFARIVAVADAFSEMRHGYESAAIPTVRALNRLLRAERLRRFDPHVVRALLMVVPPYSPAVPVLLSDGRWAVPLEHRVEDPCRPRVQVTSESGTDPTGGAAKPSGTVIDLMECGDLHIVESGGEDVTGDNFRPPDLQQMIYSAEEEAAELAG